MDNVVRDYLKPIQGKWFGGVQPGPIVSFADADSVVEGLEDTAIYVYIFGANAAATYTLDMDSSGGGATVSDSGSVSDSRMVLGPFDLSGLSAGTVVAVYTQSTGETAYDTITLTSVFRITEDNKLRVAEDGEGRILDYG